MSQSPAKYRNHIGTGTDDGKRRKWLYPKLVKGKLFRYRALLAYSLLSLLVAAPLVKFNGEQLILLNVMERKFVFFGLIFWPQDFYLFVLALISFIVFIVLFTVVFGRVFCGWACPQTIFMEMVFRRIESWIEGTPAQRQKLDNGPLSFEKLWKKSAKHSLFLLISFFIANIFLSYIIGSDTLLRIVTEPISQHLSGFISICVFTFVFYLVFSKMRELVCTVMCPYGRLQGVLLDNQSIIVAYDYQRGEPRGKLSKEKTQLLGDCVDCGLCVQVCPTGIDIRNGTQMECVNCTLCIDACDMVMEKTNRPARLIGFKSEEEIRHKTPFHLNKRIYAYAAVLLVLTSTLALLLINRTDVETTILRAAGTIYQIREADSTVSNLYNAELVNKTNTVLKIKVIPDHPTAKIQFIQKEDHIDAGRSIKITFFVILPQNEISHYKTPLSFRLMSGNREIERFETTFIAPVNE